MATELGQMNTSNEPECVPSQTYFMTFLRHESSEDLWKRVISMLVAFSHLSYVYFILQLKNIYIFGSHSSFPVVSLHPLISSLMGLCARKRVA